MKKGILLFLVINVCIFLPSISYSQSCNAINGNIYYVTTQYDYGPGSLTQAILNANSDNVGGYIFSMVDTIFLSGPPPTVTVDSLSVFVFSAINIDCQFSVSDPVFTFDASAPNSCASPSLIIYNAAAATFTVTNAGDSGPGSLREAISLSEVSSSQDQIWFNIPGISPHTIAPLNLYTVTKPLIIDGTTQPANGYTGIAPKVAFDGGDSIEGCFYFNYYYNYNTFSGKLYGCNINGFGFGVAAIGAHGITIGSSTKRNVFNNDTIGVYVDASRNVTIENNYIGVDTSGAAAAGYNFEGILIISDSNVIIKNNLISGNVWGILNNGCSALSIKGNKVGTDATGTNAIGNQHGIYLQFGDGITVGGTGASDGNLISGNLIGGTGEGIYSHFNTGVTIIGNKIGTDISGTFAIPNYHGIRIDDANATIGGLTVGSRNIISGNTYGIEVEGDAPVIQGNFIGTDKTGTTAIANNTGIKFYSENSGVVITINNNLISGNTSSGITTYNSSAFFSIYRNKIGIDFSGQNALPNNTGISLTYTTGGGMIGGIDSSFANIICGNISDGILVVNNQQYKDSIMNNIIGIDSSLTTFIPNANGIDLALNAHQNYILNNTIAGNTYAGVSIAGNSNENFVSQNAIYQNGQDGIDCLGQQNTFTHNAIGNNSGKGINNHNYGNNSIAPPVVFSADTTGIYGTALPDATVELFYSQTINAYPQGFTWIGSVTADALGNWIDNSPLSFPCNVTTTQTDGFGNTSEFSSVIQPVNLGPDSTVCAGTPFTITADSGFTSYSWNTGDTSSSITVYSTGYYSVSATNFSDCSTSDTIYVFFDPCLHVNENYGATIQVYPNPAGEEFFIEWNKMDFKQGCTMELMDVSGKIMQQQVITELKTTIETRNLPKGFYILCVKDADHILMREKMTLY